MRSRPTAARLTACCLWLSAMRTAFHCATAAPAVPATCREYKRAMRGVRARLLDRSAAEGLLFVAELNADAKGGERIKTPKMDHLVCFLPGLLALGYFHGVNTGVAFLE